MQYNLITKIRCVKNIRCILLTCLTKLMSLYEIYYVMFNALEKCPSVVLKKHDYFRRRIENSSANRSWEANRQGNSYQSIDRKSMCSVETTKSYTFNRWAAYREVKPPPCLGGVKRSIWTLCSVSSTIVSRWSESVSGWQEAMYEVEFLQYSCTINRSQQQSWMYSKKP